MGLLACLLLFVATSPLNGQKTKPPSSKAQTDGASSTASIRVAQPHGQAAPENDWREEIVQNASAPVTIIEFFDYQCPFCFKTNPALAEAIRNHPGKVRLVLKNLPLSIHPDSALAHQAALAAGEQGRFWAMHDLLFANRNKIKLPDLLHYAQQLHLDVPRFQQAVESGRFRHVIDDDRAMARGLGISSTPAFFINGQSFIGQLSAERLNAAIDDALNPRGPATATASGTVSVDKLDLSRAPVRGQAQAPVTIIEFSDLQCPFCASVTPTLRELMKQYPDQVRWVFKNFPLDFHADSPLAHAAALAAERQGKFWEMHDLIFANQHTLKRDNLLAEARSLNLDMGRFTADLDSADVKRQLETDKKEGEWLGVNGTPAFFINGTSLSGAMPMEQFQAAINNALVALGKPAVPLAPSAQSAESATVRKEPEVSFGSSDSPITLAWFSDLQSGLSSQATLLVRKLIDSHPGQIRLVFKNRPLEIHPGAMLLHEAAMAANAQGKFWQMHDLIIANPQKASRQDMLAYAKRIGLDADRFQKDLDSEKYRSLIEADLQEAQRRAVLGSPVFFLNSARIDGLQNEKLYKDIIEDQLAAKK
jgi:protein-disulfide isomerase